MKRIVLAVVFVIATAPVWAQTPKSSLADLIQAGNRKAALDKIRAGADVNGRDNFRRTALSIARAAHDDETAAILLEAGARE